MMELLPVSSLMQLDLPVCVAPNQIKTGGLSYLKSLGTLEEEDLWSFSLPIGAEFASEVEVERLVLIMTIKKARRKVSFIIII